MEFSNRRIAAIQYSAELAIEEACKTTGEWPPFHSVHEGYGVIFEEVDELWEECRKKNPNREKLRHEAIQIAAMAIRFAAELAS